MLLEDGVGLAITVAALLLTLNIRQTISLN